MRARYARNHGGETGNQEVPCSGGKEGIAWLRYQPGAQCSCPQVLNSGFLSGIPRSHPEGANWVRSRPSRALTTAKGWWRSRRCSSLLHWQAQGGATAFAPCSRDNHASPALGTILFNFLCSQSQLRKLEVNSENKNRNLKHPQLRISSGRVFLL